MRRIFRKDRIRGVYRKLDYGTDPFFLFDPFISSLYDAKMTREVVRCGIMHMQHIGFLSNKRRADVLPV